MELLSVEQFLKLNTIKHIFERECEGTLDEAGAGLSRILKQLESGKDFIMISASRGNYSTKENNKRNNALLSEFRKKLGGAYKLVGHWKECSIALKDGETIKDCKGQVSNTLEQSLLFIKLDDLDSKEFNSIAQSISKKYEQDAYVIRLNDKLTLNGKDGTEWTDLGKANKDSFSQGFSRIVNTQGYTELSKLRRKGRVNNIIFEDICTVVPKDNNSSRQLFEAIGIKQ